MGGQIAFLFTLLIHILSFPGYKPFPSPPEREREREGRDTIFTDVGAIYILQKEQPSIFARVHHNAAVVQKAPR